MIEKIKTCFVISPIGDEGSEVRSNADDLFELVISPALEIYHFNIVRADKISSPSIITNDIVRLVQESELCVVDLTGQNPNVYYECGRRHENGKPTIQLIMKGEKIPFDVAGIRTIIYDLSSARSIRDTVIIVREFVKPFEQSGYVMSSSGASLTSIADAIDRIERQLNRIKTTEISSTPLNSDDLLLKGPKQAILGNLHAGNIDVAEQLFLRFQDRLNPKQFIEIGSRLCMAGSKVGKDLLVENYDTLFDEADDDTKKFVISCIVQYFIVNDLENQGIPELKEFFERLVNDNRVNNFVKAGIYWQQSRLFFSTSNFEMATTFGQRAADLDPDEYRPLLKEMQDHVTVKFTALNS